MNEAQAWLTQVDSDWETAKLISDHQTLSGFRSSLRCQEIAKYQQVTEKSINAMDAVLREKGIIRNRAKAEHYPKRMLNRLVSLPVGRGSGTVDYIVKKVLTKFVQPDIYDVCSLAPQLPAPGERFRRNTEYPYNIDQEWTAPASEFSFSNSEVEQCRRVVQRLRDAAHRVFTMS